MTTLKQAVRETPTAWSPPIVTRRPRICRVPEVIEAVPGASVSAHRTSGPDIRIAVEVLDASSCRVLSGLLLEGGGSVTVVIAPDVSVGREAGGESTAPPARLVSRCQGW